MLSRSLGRSRSPGRNAREAWAAVAPLRFGDARWHGEERGTVAARFRNPGAQGQRQYARPHPTRLTVIGCGRSAFTPHLDAGFGQRKAEHERGGNFARRHRAHLRPSPRHEVPRQFLQALALLVPLEAPWECRTP